MNRIGSVYTPSMAHLDDNERAQALQTYLEETFLKDHSLESIARQFGCNANKLMEVFRRNFNKTIFEFLAEKRMDLAMRLLKEHTRVIEVSRAVGYKNPNHFATAFKRRYGMRPSQVIQHHHVSA